MNKRIQELAEQARPTYSNGKKVLGLNSEFHELWMEKFAELIVRECARVYWNIDDGETHTEYVEALKQHFGVEE